MSFSENVLTVDTHFFKLRSCIDLTKLGQFSSLARANFVSIHCSMMPSEHLVCVLLPSIILFLFYLFALFITSRSRNRYEPITSAADLDETPADALDPDFTPAVSIDSLSDAVSTCLGRFQEVRGAHAWGSFLDRLQLSLSTTSHTLLPNIYSNMRWFHPLCLKNRDTPPRMYAGLLQPL